MIDLEMKPVLRSAKVLEHSLSLLFSALMIAVAILVLWMVFDARDVGATLAASIGYPDTEPSTAQGVALGGLVLSQIAIWLAVVWRGRDIFAALRAGDATSASHAASLAARLLWLMLIWGVIAHMLGTVVATWHFPEGQRAINLSIGSAQISTAFAALLATFTSRAFVLGAALWQDHQEVI